MSVDCTIISPSEAGALLTNPDHESRTPLGTLGDVRRWLAQRVLNITPDGAHMLYNIAAGQGSGPVYLHTLESAGREDIFGDNYVARDDHAVTRMGFYMYRDFDFTVVGDCAARFRGTIFDHQTSELLSPEEFLSRLRHNGT